MHSLRSKILTAIVLVMSIEMGGTLYLLNNMDFTEDESNFAERAHLLAQIVAQGAAEAMWNYDDAGLARFVHSIKGYYDVAFIEIVDDHGKSLYRDGFAAAANLRREQSVTRQNKQIGKIALELSRTKLEGHLREHTLTKLAILVAAIFPLLLVVALVIRFFMRHLERLATAIDSVAAGNFHFDREITAKDEAGRLYHGFVTMSETIRQKSADAQLLLEQMDNYNGELEKRVEERTMALTGANQEIKETYGQLVQAEKLAALGELSAGIGHELAQPLNGIKIVCQGLLRDIAKKRLDTGGLDEKLGQVVRQVDKMGQIIQHMRIFTRQSVGDTRKVIGINTIVSGAFTFTEQQMVNQGIKVVKELADEDVRVKVNAVEIEQVLLNLLGNARYAMIKSGKAEKVLEVKILADPANVVVQVLDNGLGIPAEIRQKIFQPFFTTKPSGEGTGLGLSVSHRIANDHQGSISVASEPGEFTMFTLILPRCHELAEECLDAA